MVKTTVCKTINKIAGTLNVNINVKAYWEGGERVSKIETLITILTVRYIQYGIYKMRNRKRMPTVVALSEEVYRVWYV